MTKHSSILQNKSKLDDFVNQLLWQI